MGFSELFSACFFAIGFGGTALFFRSNFWACFVIGGFFRSFAGTAAGHKSRSKHHYGGMSNQFLHIQLIKFG